jgi:TRAP-type C4-dicarboxylate transport system permease small subunit
VAEERPGGLTRLIRVSRAVQGGLRVVEDGLLVAILAGMVFLAGAQIVLRNLFDSGFVWADPALRLMVLWVGMVGAMVATRFDKQITVDVASRFLPARWRAGVRVVTDVFTAGVAGTVAWHAVRLMLDDRAAGITVFASVPVWVCEAIIPIAFGVISIRYALYGVRHLLDAVSGGDE